MRRFMNRYGLFPTYNILSTLCKRKGVHIVEAEMCRDHVKCYTKVVTGVANEI